MQKVIPIGRSTIRFNFEDKTIFFNTPGGGSDIVKAHQLGNISFKPGMSYDEPCEYIFKIAGRSNIVIKDTGKMNYLADEVLNKINRYISAMY